MRVRISVSDQAVISLETWTISWNFLSIEESHCVSRSVTGPMPFPGFDYFHFFRVHHASRDCNPGHSRLSKPLLVQGTPEFEPMKCLDAGACENPILRRLFLWGVALFLKRLFLVDYLFQIMKAFSAGGELG